MVGLALAGIFAHQRDTIRRLRTTVFAFLTPFYFLNAGIKVYLPALWAGLGLIAVLLLVKIGAKFVGAWPLTLFRFGPRECNYTTLLMSTGLTFGTIDEWRRKGRESGVFFLTAWMTHCRTPSRT